MVVSKNIRIVGARTQPIDEAPSVTTLESNIEGKEFVEFSTFEKGELDLIKISPLIIMISVDEISKIAEKRNRLKRKRTQNCTNKYPEKYVEPSRWAGIYDRGYTFLSHRIPHV